MARKLFGTDGIRGRANIYPMTGEIAFTLGRAVTAFFQKKGSNKKPLIIIGKDTRLSCYMLEQAFSAGVCSQGGRAILTGPLPTPGVAFVTTSMRADAGIMISASHNSFEDNGIKIFDRTGHKLHDDIEEELEKMVLSPEMIPKKLDDQLGNAKRLDEVNGRYIVQVKGVFSSSYSLESMKIVVDCAHGASYKLGPMAFSELGAEVVLLGCQPNGTNINDHVGALYPEQCALKVKETNADIGFCFDGDADRLTVVDEKGQVVNGDQLMGLLAKFLNDSNDLDGNKEIVGTVMSNFGVEQFLLSQGLTFFRTNVGDRYIVERMQTSGSLFGGEPSGHLVFKKYATTGDGILAALKVVECIQYYQKPLSELISQIVLVPQKLINVKVSHKKDFATIDVLQKALQAYDLKLQGKGRILLRYSGTENLARVMVEGIDKQVVDQICAELADILSKELN